MAGVIPPFNEAKARQKVKAAQDAWNSKDPQRCSRAYTADSIWRNRDQFLHGTDQIIAFLNKKWEHELDYRLRKELFAFGENKIAVQFWYEYRDGAEAAAGRTVWKRCYGLEDWTFADNGKMRKLQMSGNDIVIQNSERWFTDDVDVNTVNISEKHW